MDMVERDVIKDSPSTNGVSSWQEESQQAPRVHLVLRTGIPFADFVAAFECTAQCITG